MTGRFEVKFSGNGVQAIGAKGDGALDPLSLMKVAALNSGDTEIIHRMAGDLLKAANDPERTKVRQFAEKNGAAFRMAGRLLAMDEECRKIAGHGLHPDMVRQEIMEKQAGVINYVLKRQIGGFVPGMALRVEQLRSILGLPGTSRVGKWGAARMAALGLKKTPPLSTNPLLLAAFGYGAKKTMENERYRYASTQGGDLRKVAFGVGALSLSRVVARKAAGAAAAAKAYAMARAAGTRKAGGRAAESVIGQLATKTVAPAAATKTVANKAVGQAAVKTEAKRRHWFTPGGRPVFSGFIPSLGIRAGRGIESIGNVLGMKGIVQQGAKMQAGGMKSLAQQGLRGPALATSPWVLGPAAYMAFKKDENEAYRPYGY